MMYRVKITAFRLYSVHMYVILIVNVMVSSYTSLCKYMHITIIIVYAPMEIYVVLQLDTITRSLYIATHNCHYGKRLQKYMHAICIVLQLDTFHMV